MVGAVGGATQVDWSAQTPLGDPQAQGRAGEEASSAKDRLDEQTGGTARGEAKDGKTPDSHASDAKKSPSGKELDRAEEQQVRDLETTDRKVKQHEQAHLAAAGGYARGGARFQYASGPDGRRYAVGGEVSLDMSSIPGDHQATIQKMNIIRRAALAPQDPSGTDRAVANQAAQVASSERQAIQQEKAEEVKKQIEDGREAQETSETEQTARTETDAASAADRAGESIPNADSPGVGYSNAGQPVGVSDPGTMQGAASLSVYA